MSNNCFVTKLKGVVDNDNLPRLGIVSVDYVSNPDNKKRMVFQIFSPTKDVHVKSKALFKPYGTDIKVTEYTALAGVGIYATIVASDIPSANVEDIVEFDNMYDLTLFIVTNRMGKIRSANNIESLYKYASLEIVSLNNDEDFTDIPDSAYGIVFSTMGNGYSTKTFDFDHILDNRPNLEALFKPDDDNDMFALKMSKNHNSHTTMKYSFISLEGNITDLPRNMEAVNVISLSGNVEDYVARMRELGRTSGFITFFDANYGYVKYNNTTLKALIDNNTIHNFATGGYYTTILTWTADSIAFATSLPEGAIKSKISASEYYAQKHSA